MKGWSQTGIGRQVAATVTTHVPSSRTLGHWLKAEQLQP